MKVVLFLILIELLTCCSTNSYYVPEECEYFEQAFAITQEDIEGAEEDEEVIICSNRQVISLPDFEVVDEIEDSSECPDHGYLIYPDERDKLRVCIARLKALIPQE